VKKINIILKDFKMTIILIKKNAHDIYILWDKWLSFYAVAYPARCNNA
jgi:hypothetical protein